MIGLGKWECKVDTMFYKGTITIEISDNNGEYAFVFGAEGTPIPEVNVTEVHEENGNTLVGTGTTPMLPGKELVATMTFTDDDHFDGSLKVPFLGKIKVKNGCRVS